MKKQKFLAIPVILAISFGVFLSPDGAAAKKGRALSAGIKKNKFGFLSAGSDDVKYIKNYGARWVRPHPGPFLWDSVQSASGAAYNFAGTDEIVKKYSRKKIGILATLWPFAEWDQAARADFADCAVSENDEFLQGNRDKEGKTETGSYLPRHRCDPNDWGAYENFVKAVVERYDGDGAGDMKGLKYPIKYWEAMNEPDLTGEEDRLDFFKGNASDYAELLIHTFRAVKAADPKAQVLIAGAAGGNENFLNFYRQVFANAEAWGSFDIANVHCISNDSYSSFNVEPYKNMLSEFSLSGRPIWVTEAEAIISDDAKTNYNQTYSSARQALSLGAQRIFFTRYGFPDTDKNTKKRYKRITKLK